MFYAKKGAHRALDDILESIEELKFYLQYAFRWFIYPFFNLIFGKKAANQFL